MKHTDPLFPFVRSGHTSRTSSPAYIDIVQNALLTFKDNSVLTVTLPPGMAVQSFRSSLQRHCRILQRELGVTIRTRVVKTADNSVIVDVWVDRYRGPGCLKGPVDPSTWPPLYTPVKDKWTRK